MSRDLIKLDDNLPEELKQEILADYEAAGSEIKDAVDFKPPVIKIGKATWLIGEDEKPVESFEGVIIHLVKSNAYWHEEDNNLNPVLFDKDQLPPDYTPGGKVPLCSSIGGIYGTRERTQGAANGKVAECFGKCGNGKSPDGCHLNFFGTAVNKQTGKREKGKACKNMRRLLVLVKGERYPFLISLPPTSIASFDSYVRFIEAKGKRVCYVWTHFGLDKQSDGGKTWYTFSKDKAQDKYSDLEPNLVKTIYEGRKEFDGLLGDIQITEDEYAPKEVDDADFTIEDE